MSEAQVAWALAMILTVALTLCIGRRLDDD